MTPTDNNILSAAFPCRPEYKLGLRGGISNPYYWHGRPDFDHRTQTFPSGLFTANNDNNDDEELTSSFSPLLPASADIGSSSGAPFVENLPNADQLAMAPLLPSLPSDDGINFEGIFDYTTPSDLLTLDTTNTNNIFDDENLGLGGENLFFDGTDGGDIFAK